MFCPESPRWLASQDNWDEASQVLSKVRQLPTTHPYVQAELLEMKTQLDAERGRLGGNSYWALTKEAWTIPGNRHRSIMVIALMTAQQWSGTNAINYYAPTIFTSEFFLKSRDTFIKVVYRGWDADGMLIVDRPGGHWKCKQPLCNWDLRNSQDVLMCHFHCLLGRHPGPETVVGLDGSLHVVLYVLPGLLRPLRRAGKRGSDLRRWIWSLGDGLSLCSGFPVRLG